MQHDASQLLVIIKIVPQQRNRFCGCFMREQKAEAADSLVDIIQPNHLPPYSPPPHLLSLAILQVFAHKQRFRPWLPQERYSLNYHTQQRIREKTANTQEEWTTDASE